MYKKNLIIAGFIALALHLLFLVAPSVTSQPKVIFRQGESSLRMHLIPSVVSVASTKSVKTDAQRVKEEKIEEKRIEKKIPIQKPEDMRERQVKVEKNIEQKKEETTYSAEYFKTPKEVNTEQPQIQKEHETTTDSREIIADIKEKGVVKGAMIKNVLKPFYPSSCKRRGHEGTTVLEVTILSNKKCGNIDIISSAGCKSLDKAAIKALKKADFIPAMRLSVPFTATKKIAFNFKLEDQK